MLSKLVNIDEDLSCFGMSCEVDALLSDRAENILRIPCNSCF